MAKANNHVPLLRFGWLRVIVFLLIYLSMLIGVGKLNLPFYSSFALMFLGGIALVAAFRLFIDRKSLRSLGWSWKNYENHFAVGGFMAIAILGVGTSILSAAGRLQWMDVQWTGKSFWLSLGLMTMVALSEELVFRGYVQNNLQDSMPRHIALLVSAALFAIFHAGNPNTSTIALVNIFLAGILLGINYMYTQNLWFGISLHFCWNFVQGPLLGYEVSGIRTESILVQSLNGARIYTGGEFGFEASILNTVLSTIAIFSLLLIYKKGGGWKVEGESQDHW